MLRRAVRAGAQKKLPRQATYRYCPVVASRGFVSAAILRSPYDSTLENLKIGSHTRVIFQGFTGRQATANAKDSIAWGTNIVGGVTPGREGEHLHRPVLPTVRKAMEILQPDASGIYVAAHQATGAIEEAIEAEVPLIVAVAEHIPLHDMLRIHSMLKTQSASRLVGANSPGIISAVGRCRIGFQPLPCFAPGKIGIVARSGTLSYETAASTLRAGLGQSMCIGVGGDILPGTSLKDGLRILAGDDDTEGIALIGEIGGFAEIEAADWIREYRATTSNPKPIVALVAGVNAVPGRIMGHAGAFALPGEPSALAKVRALEAAGAAIINHPSRFGPALKTMLSSAAGPTPSSRHPPRRGFHIAARRPGTDVAPRYSTSAVWRRQARSMYLTRGAALDLLRRRGIPVVESAAPDLDPDPYPDSNFDIDSAAAAAAPGRHMLLGVTVNRSTNSPCVIASPDSSISPLLARFDFDFNLDDGDGDGGLRAAVVPAVAVHLGLPARAEPALARVTAALVRLFREQEAFLVKTRISTDDDGDGDGGIRVVAARLGFDAAASRRRVVLHSRDRDGDRDQDRGIERNNNNGDDGIVYVRLHEGQGGGAGNIGTLVNGAGLAMNTVDALADAGGRAANFLDTGGKATSETVKRSFEVVLGDPRVKCVFVNIFGGLTLGDMIARGVVLAFRDLQMTVPVVVRIRGTNEEEGQRIIAESGLPLFAFDDFDEAAAKAIELARGG